MRFDYKTMKEYAHRKEPIGKYNGVLVFSMSKKAYQDLQDDRGYYYLIYDDNNYIVRNNYIYALLSENGDLNEYNSTRVYLKKDDNGDVVACNREKLLHHTEETYNKVTETKPIDNSFSEFFDRISKEIDDILSGDFRYEIGTN